MSAISPETNFLDLTIEDLINEILSKSSDVNFTSQKEKNKFIEDLAELLAEYKPEFKEKLLEQAKLEFNEVSDLLQPLTDFVVVSNFRIPSKKDLEFISGLQTILNQASSGIDTMFDASLDSMIRQLNQYEKALQDRVLKEIGKGGTLGRSIDDISKNIVKEFQKDGIKSFIANDREYSLEASATRLARTTLINGRQRAVIFEAIRNGHDLIKVSSHGDESPMCSPYSGKIYSITGSTEGYPLLESIFWNGGYKKGDGVGHPYCRHSFMVYIKSDIKFKIRGEERVLNSDEKQTIQKEFEKNRKNQLNKDLENLEKDKTYKESSSSQKNIAKNIIKNKTDILEIE
jgi:hypothetical protein